MLCPAETLESSREAVPSQQSRQQTCNHRRSLFVVVGLVFAGLLTPMVSLTRTMAQEQKATKTDKEKGEKAVLEHPFPKHFPAPELDGGVEWLNAGGPIALKDLRGKIVLLDFWTFCCINCMHVLPDLEFLEKKYAKEIVVIGVHSAKFDNEKETGNIRKAILRYEIEHPVINDANMTVWRKFNVNSWPSLVLLDAEGNYCGYVSGEGNRELLDTVIGKLIAYHKAKGTLDETPVRFDLERNKAGSTPLRFPGKVLADAAGGRLFISDSNNNRIVITSLEGKLIDVIGTGAIGAKDGGYAEAEFDHPQGMTLVGNSLYVADTENHLLRIVDLASKSVTTLAGTGEQARFRAGGGPLRKTALNSPWDLCVVDGVLYIAMAGPHQIWSHKLGSNAVSPYAGSGREDITDGELDRSALAQPSGIVSDGKALYVVDSEGSAVRKITTDPKNDLDSPAGTVTTLAGTHDLPRGRSLFEFGDVDDSGDSARFQHPLGIALHDGNLIVADSYNHKLKQLNLKTREVTTWLGTGKSGNGLDPLQLGEPAGIAIAGQKLFVADTNNHRIVVVDLTAKQASELKIAGLAPPKPVSPEQASLAATRAIDVAAQKVAVSEKLDFRVEFALPEGYKLNPEFPFNYKLAVEGDGSPVAQDKLNVREEATLEKDGLRFQVPTTAKPTKTTLLVTVTYGYCKAGKGGLCKVGTTNLRVPLEMSLTAETKVVALKVETK